LITSALIFSFSFASYADQINILDGSGNVTGTANSEDIKSNGNGGYNISGGFGVSNGCDYINGTATAKGDTGPAGGEGGSKVNAIRDGIHIVNLIVKGKLQGVGNAI